MRRGVAVTLSGLVRTTPQRLGILAAIVASAWFIGYPSPAFYEWSSSDSAWSRIGPPNTVSIYGGNAALRAQQERDDAEARLRRLIFEYSVSGYTRPDFRQMAAELSLTWLVGIGFAWAIRPAACRD